MEVTRAGHLREWALVSYHILFYMVKQYRVVAYKSIRNSLIKKIKSNLCLTNVFIHVSGCRHGLSLHPNFLEQNNPKYRTALWCTVQDLNQQTISTVCSFIDLYESRLSGCLWELKNKGKVWLGNPKQWSRVLFFNKVWVTVQTGFHKGVLN